MRKIAITNRNRIKKSILGIKKKVDINISLKTDSAVLNGEEINEVLVEKIIIAIDFGFELEDALLLTKDNWNIEYINIKDHTRRRNLEEVRSRIIGTEGKAKRTIETLTDSVIVIHNNMVGVISDSDHLSYAIQGIISLIQGAKHGNVFSYIERQNTKLRRLDLDDLGLKDPSIDLRDLD